MPSKLGGLSLPAAALQPRKTELYSFCLYPRSRGRVAKLIVRGLLSPFFAVLPSYSPTKLFPRKSAKYRTRCVPQSTGGQNS